MESKEWAKQEEKWDNTSQETSEAKDLRSPEKKQGKYLFSQQRDIPNAMTKVYQSA